MKEGTEPTSKNMNIRQRTEWKAVASLLSGFLAVPLSLLFELPGHWCTNTYLQNALLFTILAAAAICLGHFSRWHIQRNADRLKGRRTALAGLTLGYLLIFGRFAGFLPPTERVFPNYGAEAIANLQKITNAEAAYFSRRSEFGGLSDLIAAGLLDSTFGAPVSCYEFRVATSGQEYTATANPVREYTGRPAYYSAPDGVIRYSTRGVGGMGASEKSGQPVQSPR
jgi:hypothetical protein